MAQHEVTFNWSDEKGNCYDCGLPAAYCLVGHSAYETEDKIPWLRCCICAAQAAAEGESILYLFKDEKKEDAGK